MIKIEEKVLVIEIWRIHMLGISEKILLYLVKQADSLLPIGEVIELNILRALIFHLFSCGVPCGKFSMAKAFCFALCNSGDYCGCCM